MKFTTKITHSIIRLLHLEALVLKFSKSVLFFQKLIPLSKGYKQKTIRTVKRDTAVFSLDISDYMQWHIWANLEDLSWQLASNKNKEHSTIIDVGANVGAFTLKTAANLKLKNNKIISFEPNPYVFDKLSYNLNLNQELKKNITINPLGLSNKRSKLKFYWGDNNTGGGKFILNSQDTSLKTEFIDVVSLDTYIEENDVSNVSFIKIDVEGFEPFVIEGALKTIEKYKPDMFIEVSPQWWENNGFLVKDVLIYFEKFNYDFYLVVNEKITEKSTLDNLLLIKEQFNLFLKLN